MELPKAIQRKYKNIIMCQTLGQVFAVFGVAIKVVRITFNFLEMYLGPRIIELKEFGPLQILNQNIFLLKHLQFF